MLRYSINGRQGKVSALDYMLGFKKEADLRKQAKEAPKPAAEAPAAAPDAPTKRKKQNKTKEDTAVAAALADLPPPDEDESTWTKKQDDQIIKFKADNPQGKWDDLANQMGLVGKSGDLQQRFKDLKKDGKVVTGGKENKAEPKKQEPKKDEPEKKQEGKKGGKKGGAPADAEKKQDKADGGKGSTKFSDAEMIILRIELANYEADRAGWIASRLFDQTGKDVHPDAIKAALGLK